MSSSPNATRIRDTAVISGAHNYLLDEGRGMHPGPVANGSPEGCRLLESASEAFAAEKAEMLRLASENRPASWGRTGLKYEDANLRVFRDPVQKPDGTLGTQVRITPTPAQGVAVSVLPVTDEGVVLLRQYHHATRRWHITVPTGVGASDDRAAAVARREIAAKLGSSDLYLQYLGPIHPFPALLSWQVDGFVARIDSGSYTPSCEKEAFAGTVTVAFAEIERFLQKMEISDAVTLSLLALAKAAGALPVPKIPPMPWIW